MSGPWLIVDFFLLPPLEVLAPCSIRKGPERQHRIRRRTVGGELYQDRSKKSCAIVKGVIIETRTLKVLSINLASVFYCSNTGKGERLV